MGTVEVVNVSFDCQRLSPTLLDIGTQLVQPVLPTASQDGGGSLLGQQPGRSLSDARSGSCNDDYFVLDALLGHTIPLAGNITRKLLMTIWPELHILFSIVAAQIRYLSSEHPLGNL